jgi:broad specificity phosphatase PhoE
VTTFYICRHGETENNKHLRLSGWIDTPLTERGVENAETSASKLADIPIDMIISSDLGRAFTTAYYIARGIGYTDEILRSPELREVNYGELANKRYDAYPAMTPAENADFIAPQGESLNIMMARVITYIDTLSLAYPDKTILLVAHDGTINAVRANLSGENIGVIETKVTNRHDFMARFSYEGGKVTSLEEL